MYKPLLPVFALLLLTLPFSCTRKPDDDATESQREEKTEVLSQQTDTVETEAPKSAFPDTFDLMDYSALDTMSGVFTGYYDEKVNDDITVEVAVEVTLDNGKITSIAIVDSTWVHPAAAEVIPQRIIESQRLPVDALSGASVASWAIMTATAVALEVDLIVLDEFATTPQ